MARDEHEPGGAVRRRDDEQSTQDADLPRFAPVPPFRAALRPTSTDLISLACVGAFAVFVLAVAAGHIPAYADGRPLTFADVAQAMPAFAVYAKIVFWVSLAVAVVWVDGMLGYWRARVEANRSRGFMTYGDLHLAARLGWISVVFFGLPVLGAWIYGWLR